MNPKISVVVPVYNVEHYLARCIDSILGQSFIDFELILIDDGSPDRCGEMCEEYAIIDQRIRVIHQENQKLSTARNRGIDESHGEWIAFIDSDDWVHRNYLRTLFSGVCVDTDVVICNCIQTSDEVWEDEDIEIISFKECGLNEISKSHLYSTRAWGRIYRKSVIGDNRFISGTEPVEDGFFNDLLFDEHTKFSITDNKLYYYFMRNDSAIHDSENACKRLKAVEVMLDQIDAVSDEKKRRSITIRCCKHILSARYAGLFSSEYVFIKNQCKQLFSRLGRYIGKLDYTDRMKYHILFRCPLLYRLLMIVNDPTLLEYEKNKKINLKK